MVLLTHNWPSNCISKHECIEIFKSEGLPTVGSYLINNHKLATEDLFESFGGADDLDRSFADGTYPKYNYFLSIPYSNLLLA